MLNLFFNETIVRKNGVFSYRKYYVHRHSFGLHTALSLSAAEQTGSINASSLAIASAMRLVRCLALGGFTPDRAGGTVEGGELFDGGGEVGHVFSK